MADMAGFEPAERSRAHPLSKRAQSSTLSHILGASIVIQITKLLNSFQGIIWNP